MTDAKDAREGDDAGMYRQAICDDCGRPTTATVRQLASGVLCGDCEEVPNWP